MPWLCKAVIEPAVIIGVFTGGCLINRRRDSSGNQPRDLEGQLLNVDDDSNETHLDKKVTASGTPSVSSSPPLRPTIETTSTRGLPFLWDLLSRFWNKYPFLVEIWYWNLTYWVYQLLRALSARMIAGNQRVFDLTRAHALQILSLERYLLIDVELSFQKCVLAHCPDWMPLLARIYHSHICLGVAFIVYCYTYLPRSTFYRIRRTIAMDNAIAFVIVTLWRCSPPRLLPQEYGYVDVLHKKLSTHDTAWTNNRFQLTIAAMPSLHFGTALFFALCLFTYSPHKVVRWVALLWPVAMLVTIVATANHFLMDAVVGAMIPALGWRYAHWLGEMHRYEVKLFEPVWRRMKIEEDKGLSEKGADEWKRVD